MLAPAGRVPYCVLLIQSAARTGVLPNQGATVRMLLRGEASPVALVTMLRHSRRKRRQCASPHRALSRASICRGSSRARS